MKSGTEVALLESLRRVTAMAIAATLLCSCAEKAQDKRDASPPTTEPKAPTPLTVKPGEWMDLFDGETLNGWRVVKEEDFAKAGPISVKDKRMLIGKGEPFSGMVWTGGFPKEGFEVRVNAKRTDGMDIFCGLTVPVGGGHVTLVLGGWGNSVVGLSNVDYRAAVDNESTNHMQFKNNEWYNIRLRVTSRRITAWVDEELVVHQKRKDRFFDVYMEVEPLRPLGYFTWGSAAEIELIWMKRLTEEENLDKAADEDPDWW